MSDHIKVNRVSRLDQASLPAQFPAVLDTFKIDL